MYKVEIVPFAKRFQTTGFAAARHVMGLFRNPSLFPLTPLTYRGVVTRVLPGVHRTRTLKISYKPHCKPWQQPPWPGNFWRSAIPREWLCEHFEVVLNQHFAFRAKKSKGSVLKQSFLTMPLSLHFHLAGSYVNPVNISLMHIYIEHAERHG